jgi:hypothetical protein
LSTRANFPLVRTLGLALGGYLATCAAKAAESVFRPVVVVGAYHDGNVLIIGENGTGDEAMTIAVDLDYERSTPTSSWTLNYRPVYTAYRENSDLDYFGHAGRARYSRSFSAQSGFSVDAAISQSDRQGVRPFRPEQPVNFVERNTETRGDLGVVGTFAASRRNLIDWQVSGAATEYEAPDLNDNLTFGAGAGWRYAFGERDSLGFSLQGNAYLYDELPPDPNLPPPAQDTSVATAQIVGRHAFGRVTELNYGAGAVYTDSELESSTSLNVDVSMTRDTSEFSELTAGLRQSAGAGTGRGGTTLDRGAYVSYRLRAERRGIEANVLAGIWQRDGEAIGGAGAGTTTAWSSVETVGWAFNRYISANLIHSFSDQNADASQPETLNTSHHSYGFYVRWNIRGR